MKTEFNIVRKLIIAAAALVTVAASHAVNRTLILLQENNDGPSYMSAVVPPGPVRDLMDATLDGLIEGGEATKFQALASGNYQRFVNLSGSYCTRAKLLEELIKQSKDGYTVDLAILGHGSDETLYLNGGTLTGMTTVPVFNPLTGPGNLVKPGTIRTLLTEAKAQQGSSFKFKLRLVHMCNCFGGTTNDDWLAIGAKTSVGHLKVNWMPEPMITDFWNEFVTKDRRVRIAQDNAYDNASLVWQFIPGWNSDQTTGPGQVGITRIEETGAYQVLGEGDLIFKDEYQLAVNQSISFNVQANKTHNFPKVYLLSGKEYKFTASGSDTWKNGATTRNANGYSPVPFLDDARRYPANMMRLIGERFRHVDSSPLNANDGFVQNFIDGSGFSIGTSRTYTSPGFGFLNLYANDMIAAYGDNTGLIKVTIKRTK